MIITLSFSSIVYVNTNRVTQRALLQHERRIEDQLRDLPRYNVPAPRPEFQNPNPNTLFVPPTQETLLQIKRNTTYMLILINTGILLISTGFCYWFASKTLKPIEEMIEKQKKFIGNAAHEMKTPLTTMKTLLEVNLLNKNLEIGDAKKAIESTIEEIDTLTSLTNNLLKQTKYQQTAGKRVIEQIDLCKSLKKVIQKFSNQAENKGITIDFHSAELPAKVSEEDFQELLTILMDNAIKFNKEDGKIKVKTKKDSKYAYIKISDTGIGIDSKDLPHIFDRFYKADTSRTKGKIDGFGLGLSIAKDIIDRLGGEISVKSKLDVGTSFTIKIPRNI